VYSILVVESIVVELSVNSIVIVVVEHNLYSIVVAVVVELELTLYSQSGAVLVVELYEEGANSGAFDSIHGVIHGVNTIKCGFLG